MQLTAVEFAKLIRDLRCDVRPEERRANPRAPTRSQLEVVPVSFAGGPPKPQLMRVRDISRTGVGLLSPAKFELGQRLLILLPKDATEMFVLLCEVARVTRVPGDAYTVGLRMVRRVPEAERKAFMSGAPEAIAALATATTPPPVAQTQPVADAA